METVDSRSYLDAQNVRSYLGDHAHYIIIGKWRPPDMKGIVAPWDHTIIQYFERKVQITHSHIEPIRLSNWIQIEAKRYEVSDTKYIRWVQHFQVRILPKQEAAFETVIPLDHSGSWALENSEWNGLLDDKYGRSYQCDCGWCHPAEINSFPCPSLGELLGRLAVNLSLFAFALANCRNVVVDERLPNRAARRRAQTNREPCITWKTLRIERTLHKQLTNATDHLNDPGERLERALHICRGHFKEYSPDKPLMGRYSGRFWWNQHMRGREEKGVVHKNYESSVE